MTEILRFEELVKADDTLDDGKVTERTPIYVSPGGKTIERFSVNAAATECRYIFKPLTNAGLLGRERWSQRHLLPLLDFRYPRILAEAAHENPSRYWIILEDMGELSHEWDEAVLAAAVRHIYSWQRLPSAIVPASFHGLKPQLRDVLAILAEKRERLYGLLYSLDLSERDCRQLTAMIGSAGKLRDDLVVCHGDLHIGNVALSGGEVVFLDWEHVHLNSVYWDLYSLLDMTHPDFRRQASATARYDILRSYAQIRETEGWETDSFLADYDIFASVYSAWLLLLIDQDLKNGIWERDRLLLQQAETSEVLRGCIEHFTCVG